MAHENGPDNVITTPSGERIVLAPGPPRSLDGLYGLLVVAVREYRDELLRTIAEACAAREEQEEDGRTEVFESDLGQILPFQNLVG